MRALTAALAAVSAALMISGCTGHEEMKAMDAEKGGMEQQMDSTMKAETMMEDSATKSMKPKVEAMDKTGQ